MTTSRLSYASSPESDLEMSPGPSSSLSLGNLPQLVKSNSDPSIATNQDNLERDIELNNLGEGMMPPPYTVSQPFHQYQSIVFVSVFMAFHCSSLRHSFLIGKRSIRLNYILFTESILRSFGGTFTSITR